MGNVFVSHRRDDTQQAERLAADIRNAGHKVWFDEWEIEPGKSIVEEMNKGLEGAAYVVICYSASGISSPWMSREWMSTLARQLQGYDVKILPVVLTGGLPPAILADLAHVDLTSDWSEGVAKLLQTIRRGHG
jgi:hypothetical protein